MNWLSLVTVLTYDFVAMSRFHYELKLKLLLLLRPDQFKKSVPKPNDAAPSVDDAW